MTYLPPIKTPENPKIEESEIPRDYVDLPPNLAKNGKLVGEYHRNADIFFKRFEGQARRGDYEDDIQEADAMWRMSQRKDTTVTGADQQDDSLSNVPSDLYYTSQRTIVAQEEAVIFHGNEDDEPPASFKPVDTEDYSSEEGERAAEGYNLLLKNDYDQAGYDKVFKKVLFYAVKYSKILMGVEWDYSTEMRTKRVPGYYTNKGAPVEYVDQDPPKVGSVFNQSGKAVENLPPHPVKGEEYRSIYDEETGLPLSYCFVQKEVITRNCPMPVMVQPKNWYADMDIDNAENWQCLVIRDQKPYSWLVSQQSNGLFVNVENVTDGCLFQGDDHQTTSEIPDDQATNAGETNEQTANGNYDVWKVLMRAPINDEASRRGGSSEKTKGIWDKDAIPEWCEATFVGQFTNWSESGKSCVCVQLRKWPYHLPKLNYWPVFTHEDNNGLRRWGYSNLLAPLYEEHRKTLNQHYDNKDLLIKKPWLYEIGRVADRRNLVFRQGNHAIGVRPGAKTIKDALQQVDVGDVTQTTMPTLDMLRNTAMKVAGTDEPISGGYAGARTTGTEVLEVKSEAIKPLVKDTRYLAAQIFGNFMMWYKWMVDQFADPAKPIPVRIGEVVRKVVPGELYGDMRIRIDTIDRYEQEVSARTSLANYLNTNIAQDALGSMDPEAKREFHIETMQIFKLRNPSRFFGRSKHKEAEDRAYDDVTQIVNDPARTMEEMRPDPDEIHKVYLDIFEAKRKEYELMFRGSVEPEQYRLTLDAFNLQITLREQLVEQQAQGAQAQPGQAAVAPEMSGEVMGDAL